MDAATVDQDVAHVHIFASVLWYVVSACLKCFICFHMYVVASVLS
jgi:hypothetical protein